MMIHQFLVTQSRHLEDVEAQTRDGHPALTFWVTALKSTKNNSDLLNDSMITHPWHRPSLEIPDA